MTSPMVTLLRLMPPFLPGDVEVTVVEVDLPITPSPQRGQIKMSCPLERVEIHPHPVP